MIVRFQIILVLLINLTGIVKGQEYLFSVGPIYRPFIYQNYNKSDWNNLPDSYPYRDNAFNGSAIGLRIQFPFAHNFQIKTGTLYSVQNQKHKLVSVTKQHGTNQQNWTYEYGREIETKFNIISIPLIVSFNMEIGYNSNFYINADIGSQISFLTYYESTLTHYEYDGMENIILYDSIRNYIIRTPGKTYQKILMGSPQVYNEYYHETPFLYNKVLFGLTGGIEFQKVIGDSFAAGLGMFSDYDFTDSEISPTYAFPNLGGHNSLTRSKSHNFRIGFSLTAQYIFY